MGKEHIGGELYYSPSLLINKKRIPIDTFVEKYFTGKFYYFTGGGYLSILAILQNLQLQTGDEVLLPSYICPTVLLPFKKLKISYRFYKVDINLKIDTDDLQNKISPKIKLVFFINYFGFPQDEQVKFLVMRFKQNGIIVIEDMVHSFFSKLPITGNYAFNSFRKFMPIDGSVIISDKKLKSFPQSNYNKYFYYQLIGRFSRYFNFKFNLDKDKYFLKLFDKAEKHYYDVENYNFNKYNKFIFSKIDIDNLKTRRSANFNRLLSEFNTVSIFNQLHDSVIPICFPILIENRDEKRRDLFHSNIFCPIHWRLPPELNRKEFEESWYLSNKILSIPINESINNNDLEKLIAILKTIIK